jgi:hypothetical protein
MMGFPKFVNTMQDLIHLKEEFPRETKAYLQDVLDYKDQWLVVGELKEGEAGLVDETHKVEESKNQETGEVISRYQFEFKEDPNGALYRLGFNSSAELVAFIEEIGV